MGLEDMIAEIRNWVETQCKSESNKFGHEGWTHHISVVPGYAVLLAERLGADKEIVEITALLHDIAAVMHNDLFEEHHILGAVEAEKILRTYGYPQDKIERVKKCIISHRGSKNIKQESVEAICVASADAMAHIAQIPSLLHLAYTKNHLGIDEGAVWVRNKINRSWNKLCPEAKDIIRNKYESAQMLLAPLDVGGQDAY